VVNWGPFVDFVQRPQRFLITTHIRPDGDGLGSMLAMAEGLHALGKEARLVIASIMPPRYQFMDPDGIIKRLDPLVEMGQRPEAVLILDTGTWNQLGDFGPFLQTLSVPRAVIDHHQTQDDLGALRFVDTTAESTGRLVHEAIQALGVSLTQRAASDLFIAVAMDTGWFRHSNASARTFGLAADLVAAGARPDLLYEPLFENNTLPRLRLTGLVLERLQVVNEGLVAHTEIRLGDYARTGAVPQDSEDLVNYTRSIAGVEVGVFFMEQPRGGVKVSFRSRGRVNVARLAEQFGGGGHRQASGAVVHAPLAEARARVLVAIAEALERAEETGARPAG
jgi:phosphoesterase RecJ-like protein